MLTNQHVVKPAVVLTLELYVFASASKGSRQSQTSLHRFGPAVAKAEQVGAGNQFLELFRKFELEFMLPCIQLSQRHLVRHLLQHGGVRMSQNQRSLAQS